MASQLGLCDESGHPLNAARLAEMVRCGDHRAREMFNRFAGALALGIGSVINLLNPQTVIIAGRVASSSDVFLPELLAALRECCLERILEETEIVVSDLCESAGPLGTCAYVLHHIFCMSHVPIENVV
jgi:glucokinase